MQSSMIKSSTLFECAPLRPMSAWRPPDIIHMISVPKTFPFFFLPFYCFHFILNTNRRTKMGEAWEQGTSGCYWGLSKVLPQNFNDKTFLSRVQCIIVTNSFCRHRPLYHHCVQRRCYNSSHVWVCRVTHSDPRCRKQ